MNTRIPLFSQRYKEGALKTSSYVFIYCSILDNLCFPSGSKSGLKFPAQCKRILPQCLQNRCLITPHVHIKFYHKDRRNKLEDPVSYSWKEVPSPERGSDANVEYCPSSGEGTCLLLHMLPHTAPPNSDCGL